MFEPTEWHQSIFVRTFCPRNVCVCLCVMYKYHDSASQPLLWQKPSSVMSQPPRVDWSSGNMSSEQLSLELHQVEREIDIRTQEMAMVSETCNL